MKNTRVEFMYRDGDNYKYHGQIVVKGTLAWLDLLPFLNDGEYFAPEDVGIAHPGIEAEGFPNEQSDHCWCEIDEDCLKETNEEPTYGTAAQLLERFHKASAAGWPAQFEGTTACHD